MHEDDVKYDTIMTGDVGRTRDLPFAADNSQENALDYDISSGIDAAATLASLSYDDCTLKSPAYNTRKASFSLYNDDVFDDDKPSTPPTSPRKTTKVGWTKDECDKLRNLVESYANKRKISWIEIAKHFHGKRNAKRCREKWVEYLDPQLSGASFTPEDDALILKQQARLGNRWRDIAQMMKKRRSATAVKVRWHQLRDQRDTMTIPLKNVESAPQEDECCTDRSGSSSSSSSSSSSCTSTTIPPSMSLATTEISAPSSDSSTGEVYGQDAQEEDRSKQLVWAMPLPKRKRNSSPTLPKKRSPVQPLQSTLPKDNAPLVLPAPLLSQATSSAPIVPPTWQAFVNQQMQHQSSQSMYSINYMPMMLYPQPNHYMDITSMYPFVMQQPVYYGCCPQCGPNVICRGHAAGHGNRNKQA